MWVVGISCYYHDSAACIVKHGRIVAAAHEERFTRVKHDATFPKNAIRFCLEEAGITLDEVSYVVFYEKPFLKFERIIQTFLHISPMGFLTFLRVMPIWTKNKLFQKRAILQDLKMLNDDREINKDKLLFDDHHRAHAASAYYTSSFDEALVIVMDGVGEWNATSIGVGKGNRLEMKESQQFPHSIGLLYSAFTYFLGFKVNSGEYKVMGLAPYGKPIYKDLILNNLVLQKGEGVFELNLKYFSFLATTKMTGKRIEKLFGITRRIPESEITQVHFDIAASIQSVTSILVMDIVKYAVGKYPSKNLCLAGGVALNCVVNYDIAKHFEFERIWIPPASGDAGGAVGAALDVWCNLIEPENEMNLQSADTTYFGQEFTSSQIEKCLISSEVVFRKIDDEDLLAQEIARLVLNDQIVGLFQGKAEFGPRALGNRSILGNAYSDSIQSELNLKIKFRESFRPFAPAVIKEDASILFDLEFDSPYMLFTAKLRAEYFKTKEKKDGSLNSIFPSVIHVDGSARIQTVDEKNNSALYKILQAIKLEKGYGIIANTSFNVRGEPIVNSPKDALNCFRNTNMDYLVLGPYVVSRTANGFPYIESSPLLGYD